VKKDGILVRYKQRVSNFLSKSKMASKLLSVCFMVGMIMFFVFNALWVVTESDVFLFLAIESLIISMLCSQLEILLFDYLRGRVKRVDKRRSEEVERLLSESKEDLLVCEQCGRRKATMKHYYWGVAPEFGGWFYLCDDCYKSLLDGRVKPKTLVIRSLLKEMKTSSR